MAYAESLHMPVSGQVMLKGQSGYCYSSRYLVTGLGQNPQHMDIYRSYVKWLQLASSIQDPSHNAHIHSTSTYKADRLPQCYSESNTP